MEAPGFEKVMEEVGDSGRHQFLLYWLFVVPINFLIPWMPLAPIFMSSTPTHWCHVPGRHPSITLEHWKSLTIPRETKDGSEVFSSCSQFNVTSDLLLTFNLTSDATRLAQTFSSTYGVVGCQAGWEYDHTDYDTTLSTEMDWVCHRDSLASTWLSVGLAGNVVGTLVFNSFSDILGRRPAVVMSTLMFAVFGLARLYVKSYAWIMVTMFLASTSFPPVLELCLIITMEQVSPGWRARITSTSFLLWTAGMCFLPLLAWLTRDWQLLGLITTIPFFLVILCWWLLPESPRWLLSRNRVEECSAILRTIASRNGKPVPHQGLEEKLKSIALVQNTEKNYGAFQLFKYPTVRLRTVLLTACYTLNNLFYYGLTFNIINVSGNVFINFFLLSISEAPSNLLGWWGSDFLGRRWTAAGALFLAAISVSITALFLNVSTWAMITMLILAKMFITISFLVLYIQCAEVYPTTHRACGTGLSSLVSSCIGVLVPYIGYVAVYGAWLPYIILIVTGLLGFLCASFLPETLNVDLPQSLLDANNFLTSEKYWSYKGKRLWFGKARIKQNSVTQGHVNLAISDTEIASKNAD